MAVKVFLSWYVDYIAQLRFYMNPVETKLFAEGLELYNYVEVIIGMMPIP